MLSNRGPQMIERDWQPGFTIDLQQKDLRLVLEAADEVGAPASRCGIGFSALQVFADPRSGIRRKPCPGQGPRKDVRYRTRRMMRTPKQGLFIPGDRPLHDRRDPSP